MRRWVLEHARQSAAARRARRAVRWQAIGDGRRGVHDQCRRRASSPVAVFEHGRRAHRARADAGAQTASIELLENDVKALLIARGPAALLAAAGGLSCGADSSSLDEPLTVAAPLRFKVAPGSALSHVAAASRHRASSPVRGPGCCMRAGRARHRHQGRRVRDRTRNDAARNCSTRLVSGQVVLHSLTIVDGWRVQDLLLAIQRNPDIVVDAAGQAGGADGQQLGFAGRRCRRASSCPRPIASRAAPPTLSCCARLMRRWRAILDAAWVGRDPAIAAARAPHELLIMASIVEKESGVPAGTAEDRRIVSAPLAHRHAPAGGSDRDLRARRGAMMASCTRVDLRTDGPYNTYTRAGLPPTPIALGRRSRDRGDRASGEDRRAILRRVRQGRRQPRVFSHPGTAQRRRGAVPRAACASKAAEPSHERSGPFPHHRGNRGRRQDHSGCTARASPCRARASRTS